MIDMTDMAATKIKHLTTEKGVADGGLRVKVVGGGCAGHTYTL